MNASPVGAVKPPPRRAEKWLMSLLAGACAIVAVVALIFWSPFSGSSTDFSEPRRGFAKGDRECIATWNAGHPADEFFITGYEGSAIVVRRGGQCLVSTGLDGYLRQGGAWVKVRRPARNWANARHDATGRLRPADDLVK